MRETHCLCVCLGFSACVFDCCVCFSPSSFFPACFLLILDSSALQGESENERQGTVVTKCKSLLSGMHRFVRTSFCTFCYLRSVSYPAVFASRRAAAETHLSLCTEKLISILRLIQWHFNAMYCTVLCCILCF